MLQSYCVQKSSHLNKTLSYQLCGLAVNTTRMISFFLFKLSEFLSHGLASEWDEAISFCHRCYDLASGSEGAAALLGMKPTTLYSRILALGLRAKESANTNSRVA